MSADWHLKLIELFTEIGFIIHSWEARPATRAVQLEHLVIVRFHVLGAYSSAPIRWNLMTPYLWNSDWGLLKNPLSRD